VEFQELASFSPPHQLCKKDCAERVTKRSLRANVTPRHFLEFCKHHSCWKAFTSVLLTSSTHSAELVLK